jgi:hypothetical protein
MEAAIALSWKGPLVASSAAASTGGYLISLTALVSGYHKSTTAILSVLPYVLPIGLLGCHFILDLFRPLGRINLGRSGSWWPIHYCPWRNSLSAALRLVPDLTVCRWPHGLASHMLNVLLFRRFIPRCNSSCVIRAPVGMPTGWYLRCLQLAKLVLWFGCWLAFIASVLRHDLVQALLLMARGALLRGTSSSLSVTFPGSSQEAADFFFGTADIHAPSTSSDENRTTFPE